MAESVVAVAALPSNVVLDIDGCLTLGGAAIPGAAETITALVGRGITCVIATNNSTRTRSGVAEMLSDLLDMTIPPEWVVTSAMAAVGLLEARHGPVLVVGEVGVREAITDAGLGLTDDFEAARSVVIGLDRSFDFDRLTRAAAAVRRGAFLVASNDDATFPAPGGVLPGAGAIVAAVEAASGSLAVVAGKPHPPMLAAVSARLRPGVTWMVGDRPETDVAFARAAGWRAVLVLTGIARSAAEVPDDLKPDVILPSIADLPGLLA
ncbi:MAG: HAD-IIA family hydrolase [Acidimicrobiia bacterium]|nr:HAD-IIA family hydrolase [Acidimicrobiia bacterium]